MARSLLYLRVEVSVSILALLLLGCPADEPPGINPPDPVEGPLLITGAERELGTAAYTAAEGTWTYEDPGDALDGLTIHVPEETWPDGASLVVSAAEVTSHGFGDDVEVISPLITVDDAGVGYGDRLVDVLVPVVVPDGHFAMGFFYDADRNAVSGMALLELEQDAVRVGTSHFSSFFITSIRQDLLEAEQTTSFEHGFDSWQHTNMGAFATPGGYCVGQSLSMWWWEARGPEVYGEDWKPLYGLFDNESRAWATPGFDHDDELAIRISTYVQAGLGFAQKSEQQKKLEDLQRNQLPDIYTLNAFAFAMYLTGEPQLVAMYGPEGGHAILAYGKDAIDPEQRLEPPGVPAGIWTCPMEAFDADDGCDCGCGVVDPDCDDAEAASCDSCNLPGSCNTQDSCPGDLNEGYNAVCGAVPEPVSPSEVWLTGPGILRVSDPNTPNPDEDRIMIFDYDTGRFETFYSGASARRMGVPFDSLLYMGNDTMMDPQIIQDGWQLGLAEQLDMVSPTYDLEVQAPGGGWQSFVQNMTIAGEELRLRVTNTEDDFEAALFVYNQDQQLIHLSVGELDDRIAPLRSGAQTIGVLVLGNTREGYTWVDFEWFDLVSEDAPDGPMLERTIPLEHAVSDLSIQGDHAYVVAPDGKLVVVHLVDDSESLVGTLSGHSDGRGIDAGPDLLAMTAGSFHLATLPDPGTPVIAESWGFNSDLRRVKLGGDVAFAVGKLTYTDRGAFAVAATWDPTDSSVQRGRALLHLGEALIDVELSEDGTLAFASGNAGELFVIDVSDPDAPLDIAATPTTSWGNGGGVFVDGEGLVWMANPGLRAFDVTVPAAPVLLNGSAYDIYDTDSRDVVVVDTTALLVGMGYDSGGWGAVFDVSDPTNPVYEDRLDFAGVPTDVEVVGRRAYVGLVMPDGRGEIAVVAF